MSPVRSRPGPLPGTRSTCLLCACPADALVYGVTYPWPTPLLVARASTPSPDWQREILARSQAQERGLTGSAGPVSGAAVQASAWRLEATRPASASACPSAGRSRPGAPSCARRGGVAQEGSRLVGAPRPHDLERRPAGIARCAPTEGGQVCDGRIEGLPARHPARASHDIGRRSRARCSAVGTGTDGEDLAVLTRPGVVTPPQPLDDEPGLREPVRDPLRRPRPRRRDRAVEGGDVVGGEEAQEEASARPEETTHRGELLAHPLRGNVGEGVPGQDSGGPAGCEIGCGADGEPRARVLRPGDVDEGRTRIHAGDLHAEPAQVGGPVPGSAAQVEHGPPAGEGPGSDRVPVVRGRRLDPPEDVGVLGGAGEARRGDVLRAAHPGTVPGRASGPR